MLLLLLVSSPLIVVAVARVVADVQGRRVVGCHYCYSCWGFVIVIAASVCAARPELLSLCLPATVFNVAFVVSSAVEFSISPQRR